VKEAGLRKTKLHVFSHMWKTEPKDKQILRKKPDHTNADVEHICNSGTALGTGGSNAKWISE
jgi:hypothetical protein